MHVRKAQHTDGVLSASRVAPTPHRGVAGFNRIQWQLSIGMGGNLQLESVAGFNRNQWQLSRGIRKEGQEKGYRHLERPLRLKQVLLQFSPRALRVSLALSNLPFSPDNPHLLT